MMALYKSLQPTVAALSVLKRVGDLLLSSLVMAQSPAAVMELKRRTQPHVADI